MFQPEFTAVCDTCVETTMWFKANKLVQSEDGQARAAKGYKCSVCETFEEKVLDTRGRIWKRT